MSVVTRCGAVSLVLGLFVGAVPALAQTAPTQAAGSSWVDPPVRGSASPEGPTTAKPVDVKPEAKAPPPPPADAAQPAQSAAVPPAATPAEKAAVTLGVTPVGASSRTAASSHQNRRSMVRPRMVERPLILARRPERIVERSNRHERQRLSRRTVRGYAVARAARAYGRADPYDGRRYASTWSRRRSNGWGELIEDNTASRVARAREAGYTLMRLQTFAYPDGSLAQRLSPYGGGLD